ncbi:MAG: hypothetical protein L0332_03415 [Chloroflexi bacterium]|nr:hypothetical protein [Chloroflexota bacterium]MCI0579655.1 hypothetical protein [Chloroflexota bacterium]MCI0645905.1 hypothetical protein [Chloroflexota bacterium]MCI0725760.1 hypothetical protein [Chloroflexota bacterium]
MTDKRRLLLLALLVGLAVARPRLFAQDEANSPWFDDFAPSRQLWISPGGAGDGQPGNPMSFADAVAQAGPGDLYWLEAGVYQGGSNLIMTQNGTAEAPILYRACPNARVTLDGGVGYLSQHTWLWGLEITNLTDPGQAVSWINTPDGPVKGGSALVNVRVAGGRLINNVIHDSRSGQSGIGGWDGGAGQVYYGNLVYSNGHEPDTSRPPHGVYAQNRFERDGYKYFVNNIFLDHAELCGEKCYNFNAHTQGSGYVSGFYVFQNIFGNGRFAIGGANAHASPSDNHVVTNNYFFNAGKIQLGFRKPWQGQFIDNYVAGNSGVLLTIWGAGEENFSLPDVTVVQNNSFVHSSNRHYLDLYAMTSTAPVGTAGLRSDDVIDENYYGEGMAVKYWVDDKTLSLRSLEEWQVQSGQDRGAAGFDLNSTVGPDPAENAVFLIPNEYEAGRGHLAIYNWSGSATTPVDLSGLLAPGSDFVIKDPRDFYGDPVVGGIFTGEPVDVPTPETFQAYVVLPGRPAGNSPCLPIGDDRQFLPIFLFGGILVVVSGLGLVVYRRFHRHSGQDVHISRAFRSTECINRLAYERP